MAILIHVWMKCDEHQKPNNIKVPVYSLPLYDLMQK